MTKVEGKHFGAESVIFGQERAVPIDPVRSDWSRDIQNAKLISYRQYLLRTFL